MKWSKEAPSEPGWYFALYEGYRSDEDKQRHVEVYRVYLHLGDVLMAKIGNIRQDVRFMTDSLHIQWAGPIPLPDNE